MEANKDDHHSEVEGKKSHLEGTPSTLDSLVAEPGGVVLLVLGVLVQEEAEQQEEGEQEGGEDEVCVAIR